MTNATIKNIHEIENAAEKHGMSPGLEARFGHDDLECEQTAFSYQKLAPGFRMPFGHKHQNAEELYVVTGGGGRVKLDDLVQDVNQGDVIRVGPAIMRAFEAGPDGLEFFVFSARDEGKNDAEMKPDWWSD